VAAVPGSFADLTRPGHHRRVHARGELEAICDGLGVLLSRVTALVEGAEHDASRDDLLELVAVERGLAATQRRLQRLTARPPA
jgi:hypothetical protein